VSSGFSSAVRVLRQGGWEAGERWLVVRDGDRPRTRWAPLALSLLVLLVAAVNARALARSLLS